MIGTGWRTLKYSLSPGETSKEEIFSKYDLHFWETEKLWENLLVPKYFFLNEKHTCYNLFFQINQTYVIY